ncbi:alpha/beta fold hydrolase, partial [Actinoplanes sp. NPDC051633]|uniref:alpha/beta hydrolase n=1 Tax=Actinoplanes sp. NPDC051633 TaxID=3155670 RepID=UPI0034392C88
MSFEKVTFTADGVLLAGNLAVARAGAPAVVLTGPFTGVKEQVVGVYAARLHEHGLTTLAFDHRGFGESGGRRAHEDTQGKLADLRAAADLLAAHPAVDPNRVAIVGICLGGGYAVRAAATDPRLRAVVGIAGAYNSPLRISAGDADGYRAALASFIDRYDEELPAVAPDGGTAAMAGDEPYAYYGTTRSAAPHWENRVTYGSLHALMTFDALGAAALLAATPLLVVHGRTD